MLGCFKGNARIYISFKLFKILYANDISICFRFAYALTFNKIFCVATRGQCAQFKSRIGKYDDLKLKYFCFL